MVYCAHRFLAKPCETETLVAALNYATTIGFTLQNKDLAALIGKIDRLPPQPSLLLDLQRQLASPNVSVEAIGQLIAKDIALTAEILKLVNSAFFGLPRRRADVLPEITYFSQ